MRSSRISWSASFAAPSSSVEKAAGHNHCRQCWAPGCEAISVPGPQRAIPPANQHSRHSCRCQRGKCTSRHGLHIGSSVVQCVRSWRPMTGCLLPDRRHTSGSALAGIRMSVATVCACPSLWISPTIFAVNVRESRPPPRSRVRVSGLSSTVSTARSMRPAAVARRWSFRLRLSQSSSMAADKMREVGLAIRGRRYPARSHAAPGRRRYRHRH